MRTLRAGYLFAMLALSSSLGAQHASSILTDEPAPAPPPRPGTIRVQAPPPSNPPGTRSPNGAVRISGGIMAGQIVKRVMPACSSSGVSRGVVVMHAIIGTDGKVQQLALISGPPDPGYTATVMDAVRQWEYKPYLLNGEPVTVDTTIIFDARTANC